MLRAPPPYALAPRHGGVPVVQRIEQQFPKLLIWVRFPTGILFVKIKRKKKHRKGMKIKQLAQNTKALFFS